MDARDLARLHAAGRVAMGVALAAAPGRLGGAWIGSVGDRPEAQVLTVALGARDLGIGAGALAALGRGGAGARPWILAGVVADAADLAATLRARRMLPPLAVVGVSAIAGGSVALGLRALRSVGQREP